MIKQLTIKNLYNFKDEITFDFDTKKKDFVLAHKFNEDYIGNFSLVYGKNNVGKSNLFRILKEAKDFILNGNMNLEPYRPYLKEESSIFEIVFEKNLEEIRYGFEIMINNSVIIDEWLFVKRKSPNKNQLSSRETVYFLRKENKFHSTILVNDRRSLNEIKDVHLFINYFNTINHNHDVIKNLIKHINSLKFINCIESNKNELNFNIINLLEDKNNNKLFTEFLRAADLDIKEVVVQELNKKELEFLGKMKAIYSNSQSAEELEISTKNIMDEFEDILPSLVRKNIIGKHSDTTATEGYSIQFKHRSGANFDFHDLSSGTKQMINIFSTFVSSLKEHTILIFDEIESGLHLDLIDLAMNFFRDSIGLQQTNQFIITTHREELLDYPFISKENIMFLKYDKATKSPYVEYLSEYRTRKEQKLSKRYKLNAFDSNPDTSQAYNVKTILSEMQVHENN